MSRGTFFALLCITPLGIAGCGSSSSTEDPDAAPTGPTGASDLTATVLSAAQVNLGWTDNSEDEAGFRVERRLVGAASFTTVTTLAADATSYLDVSSPGGNVEYRVVAYHTEDGDPSNVAAVLMPLGRQRVGLSINLATMAVTIEEQPVHFNLSGTAVDIDGSSLTLTLTVENQSGRIVFNAKAVIDSIGDDDTNATSTTADGDYAGSPYAFYGNAGIDLEASEDAAILIENIPGGATTVNMQVTIHDHPLVLGTTDYYGGNLRAYDSSGTEEYTEIDIDQFTYDGGYSNPMHGAISADGRYAYYGLRNQPAIITVDLTTLTPAISNDLSGGTIAYDGSGSYGHTRDVKISPDGQFLYVVLSDGAHTYECSYDDSGIDIEVVKLNRMTMAEVGRATLVTDVDEARGGEISLSADGSRAALPIRVYGGSYGSPTNLTQGRFFVLNTADMTIIDGDTTALEAFDVSAVGEEVDATTISADGTKVYVSIRDASDDDLRVVDIATRAITTMAVADFDGGDTRKMTYGPDGRLYWVRGGDVAIYDEQADSWSVLDTDGSYNWSVGFTNYGLNYFVFDHSGDDVEMFNIRSDSARNAPADGGDTASTPSLDEGHADLVTPF